MLASRDLDRQRHGDRGRGRAARRHDLPVVVRQDAAGAPDGGRPLQHPDHPRHLRLSAERPLPGQARRHRGGVHRLGAGDVRQAVEGDARRHVRPRHHRPRRLRRHGHRQLDAHRLRGARHDAARRGAGARQQPDDVRPRPPVGPPHRRDGVGGPDAAADPDAGRVPQRRGVGAGRQRIDQLRQAPAGHRRRSRRRRRRLRALQRARRAGARC